MNLKSGEPWPDDAIFLSAKLLKKNHEFSKNLRKNRNTPVSNVARKVYDKFHEATMIITIA